MYNGLVGLTKTDVDLAFDKISEIGQRQIKEKCFDYITVKKSFFYHLY